MNRTTVNRFSRTILLGAAFLASPLFAADVPAPDQVDAVTGTAQIKKLSGGKPWDAAAASPLADGEKITTDAASSADLSLSDGSKALVGENSDFRIIHVPGAEGAQYHLFKGQVELTANSPFSLEAGKDTYQAGKGHFILSYNNVSKKARLTVSEGTVSVSNGTQTETYGAGPEIVLSGSKLPPGAAGAAPQMASAAVTPEASVATPLASPTAAPTAPATVAQTVPAAQATEVSQAGEETVVAAAPQKVSVNLGFQYDAWDSNVEPLYDGWEAWVPFSARYVPSKEMNFYVQTAFSHATYNGNPGDNFILDGLADTQLGGEIDFNTFNMPSAFLLSMNLPTGDPSWENKAVSSAVPTDFINSRYQGRGFGISALYAFSAPIYNGSFGLAVGYQYSSAFNPSFDNAEGQDVSLGDSLVAEINRVWVHSADEHDVVQASFFYFLPSQADAVNTKELGPNLNLSYAWKNPRGFSWSFGGQYYFPGWLAQPDGSRTPDPHKLFGPRLSMDASYAIGDFTLLARSKYVFANDHPETDTSYDGGGLLLGGGASLAFRFDKVSSITFNGSYDHIDANNLATTSSDRVNASLNQWAFGTNFGVNFQ